MGSVEQFDIEWNPLGGYWEWMTPRGYYVELYPKVLADEHDNVAAQHIGDDRSSDAFGGRVYEAMIDPGNSCPWVGPHTAWTSEAGEWNVDNVEYKGEGHRRILRFLSTSKQNAIDKVLQYLGCNIPSGYRTSAWIDDGRPDTWDGMLVYYTQGERKC